MSIRIDCWNGEEEVIKELLPLSKEVDRDSYKDMTIFTFDINENVVNEIIYNGFNKNKQLKWFSFYKKKEKYFFLQNIMELSYRWITLQGKK